MLKFGSLQDIALIKNKGLQLTLDGKLEMVGQGKVSTKENNAQVGLFEALAIPKLKKEEKK